MPNVSYDTLTITINADSKQANTNISKLSTNLQKLDKTARELDKEKVLEMKELLQDIASIDFTNVANGLQSIVKAFKAFTSKSFMKATNGGSDLSGAYQKGDITKFGSAESILSGIDLSSLSTAESYISSMIADAQQLNVAFSDTNGLVKELADSMESLDLREELEKIGLNAKQVEEVFKSINYETKDFTTEQLEQVENILQEIGFSAEESTDIISRLGVETEKTGKKGKSGLGKILFQFKNIIKYRIIRKIIQDIYKAIQEGFQSILQFDTKLQDSYNKIRDSFKYLIDSFGALISPLVQALTPIIVELADAVSGVANELAKMFAYLNGSNGYAKAIKGTKDWVAELKKTQSIGIDELNVIGQSNNKGNFEWVELSKTGGALVGIISKLKTLLDQVLKILDPILNIVNTLLEAIMPILEQIIDFITPIIDIVVNGFTMMGGALEWFVGLFMGDMDKMGKGWETMWKGMAKMLLSVVEFFASCLDWIINAFVEVGDWIGKMFGGGIDWRSNLAGGVRGFVNSFASGGFPEDGLFFANHNELVGQFSNGQTAVANNQQITEGIYQAVLSAMRDSGGANGGEVVINLDGYEMARVITKRQNNFGQVLVSGGNINYGK